MLRYTINNTDDNKKLSILNAYTFLFVGKSFFNTRYDITLTIQSVFLDENNALFFILSNGKTTTESELKYHYENGVVFSGAIEILNSLESTYVFTVVDADGKKVQTSYSSFKEAQRELDKIQAEYQAESDLYNGDFQLVDYLSIDRFIENCITDEPILVYMVYVDGEVIRKMSCENWQEL